VYMSVCVCLDVDCGVICDMAPSNIDVYLT